MKNLDYGNCKNCKKPRVRKPWQHTNNDQNQWGWMIYCEHCHHISSFAQDKTKPAPSKEEIEETIEKYRAWL